MPARTSQTTSAPSTMTMHNGPPTGGQHLHFAVPSQFLSSNQPSRPAQPAQSAPLAQPQLAPAEAVVSQPPPPHDSSSGDASRRSSFGGSGGLTMRAPAKHQRVASTSTQALLLGGNDAEIADRRQKRQLLQQQQLQPQAQAQRQIVIRDYTRHGSRNNNGRPGAQKPPLLRSKSDYSRHADDGSESFESGELSRWGARHGFEDHYQSEAIISHLASVCLVCPRPLPNALLTV